MMLKTYIPRNRLIQRIHCVEIIKCVSAITRTQQWRNTLCQVPILTVHWQDKFMTVPVLSCVYFCKYS